MLVGAGGEHARHHAAGGAVRLREVGRDAFAHGGFVLRRASPVQAIRTGHGLHATMILADLESLAAVAGEAVVAPQRGHSPPRRQQSGERDPGLGDRDPGLIERIPGPALVTGANGYIASWVVRRLLERGFDVHATVRDPTDPRKTEHLLAMAEGLPAHQSATASGPPCASPGTLSLFPADLMERGGFDRAMAGCSIVFHTASPVLVRGVDDPVRQLIEPATRGTRNVLEAANRTPSVRRVVLTSSVSAIYGDAVDMRRIEAGRFDESHWNETSSERHLPYSYAKTEAERLAWRIAGKQDRWDLVVVNPGLVLGPALSPHASPESVELMGGDVHLRPKSVKSIHGMNEDHSRREWTSTPGVARVQPQRSS